MTKAAPVRDRPGASAAAEGRRVGRARGPRRLAGAAGVAAAVAAAATGTLSGQPAAVALVVSAAVAAWCWRTPVDPGRWERGAAGEMATAKRLDRLPRRFVVLHDRRLGSSRGNVDHLVIGPTGVWVVDSKVRRGRLTIHRGQVWAGQHLVDTAPAARQAAQVGERLGVAARPLVAVHGDGLRRRGKLVGSVRVIPAESLERRLRRGRWRLSRVERAERTLLTARADELFPPRLPPG